MQRINLVFLRIKIGSIHVISDNASVAATSIDLKKAFDTTDHQIHFRKSRWNKRITTRTIMKRFLTNISLNLIYACARETYNNPYGFFGR